MKVSLLLAIVVVVLGGTIGCSASQETTKKNLDYDISWFVTKIEDSGVSISTRGAPSRSGRAVSSSRLILNNLDVVDVYEYSDDTVAHEEGMSLLALPGHRDVYVKGRLLVVHVGREGSGVVPILYETLGQAL